MQVIDVPPSITLLQWLQVHEAHKSPLRANELVTMYTLCDCLRVDPAFFLALWLHEQGTPLGQSDVGQKTRNPLNIKAYGRAPYKAINGVRWNVYSTWLAGCVAGILHLRTFYGDKGLLEVGQIIRKFAPPSDNNKPDSYIKAVLRDMAYMSQRKTS